uniref:SfiI-subtelomeric related protein family member, putative n=1 Tax=Theileria annulata TaxID=5874 RepID=A0A3B0NHV6_THEAN
MFDESLLNYNRAYFKYDLDYFEPEPVELNINHESSASEFRYYEEFDTGHYMCRENYAFNKVMGFVSEGFERRLSNNRIIIAGERQVIWSTSEVTHYARHITVKLNNIYKNNKSIILHLVNGDVKRLSLINGKWVENSRTELDITKGCGSKQYKISGEGRIINFQTCDGYVFNRIVQSQSLFFDNKITIWEAENGLECSKSVSMFSRDKGSKYLAVLMVNNDYQLFYKANDKKGWKNITRKRLTRNIFRRHKIEKTILKNLEGGFYETVIYDMYYIVRLLRNNKGRIGFYIYQDQVNCDYYYTNLMTNRVVVTHNGMFLEVDPKKNIYTNRNYDLEFYNESDYDKSYSPDSGNDRLFDPFFCYKNNSFKTKSVAITDVQKRFFNKSKPQKLNSLIPKLENITIKHQQNNKNTNPDKVELSSNNDEINLEELRGITLDIRNKEGGNYYCYRDDHYVHFDCKNSFKFDRVILCGSLYTDTEIIWEQNDPTEIVRHVSLLNGTAKYVIIFSSYYRYKLFKCSSDRTWENITENVIEMGKFTFYDQCDRTIDPSEISVDFFKFQFELKINCHKVVYDETKICESGEVNHKLRTMVVKLLENRVDLFYTEKLVKRLLIKDNKVQISIHNVCDHHSFHKPTLKQSNPITN